MKRISKIIALCATFFIAGTFTLPAQFAPMDAHAAANVKINKTKATISKGDTLQLRVTGTKKNAKWSSNKKSIAMVSSKGKVTGKKTGKATITAKVGGKKYICKVTVTKPDYKKLIVGIWTGPIDNDYVAWTFRKNGTFSFVYYYDFDADIKETLNGKYRVSGNQLILSSHEVYTIKELKKGSYLKLKNSIITYKLYGRCY